MLLMLGLRDREALDIVAAPREQADHACEHTGLVGDEHRERVGLVRIVPILEEVGGCWLVHVVCSLPAHTSALPPANAFAVASSLASAGNSISLCALPDGIIGKQFSSAATRQSNSTGFLTLIISLIASSRSPGLIAWMPCAPKASASLTKSGNASV